MNDLNTYILKNKISKKKINEIKQFLIDYFHVSNWKECIDKQKYGSCKKICKLITDNFPNTFDKEVKNIFFDFSEIAIEKINDDEEMNGNHFVLTKGKQIYDFCKGSNSINGIYVLTQYEDMRDKYEIIWSKEEENLITVMALGFKSK